MKQLTFEGVYKPELLADELYAALGLQGTELRVETSSTHAYVTVPDAIQDSAVQAVVNAHDPEAESQAERVNRVHMASQTQAQNIPNWASWTETDVLAWFEANVDSLLDLNPPSQAQVLAAVRQMRTAQKAMARMIVALRNAQWPQLED